MYYYYRAPGTKNWIGRDGGSWPPIVAETGFSGFKTVTSNVGLLPPDTNMTHYLAMGMV